MRVDASPNHMDNFEKFVKERAKQLIHKQREYENAVRMLRRRMKNILQNKNRK